MINNWPLCDNYSTGIKQHQQQQLKQLREERRQQQELQQLKQLKELLKKYENKIKASISIDNTINVTVLQLDLQLDLYNILSTHFKEEFKSLGVLLKYTKNGLNGIAYDNIIVEKIKEIENKKI